MEADEWSWKHMSSDVASDQAAALFFTSGAPVEAYRDSFYASAGVILLYGFIAATCHTCNLGCYRKLKDTAKLILVSHIAYLLVFLGTAAPYSFAMVKVLFAPGAPANLLQPSMQRCIFYPLGFQLALYVFEGAFRAVLHINWFLFVHHLVFCTFLVLAFQSQSIFVIKVDLIVSCFATYEFLLYASLISRRVHTLLRLFRPMLVVGIGLYLLTRLVQSAMLIGLFVLSYDSMQVSSKTKALYWVSMALCLVLVVLQSYTYVIYYSIWTSTNSKLMRQHNPPTNEASINCDQMASFQECHV